VRTEHWTQAMREEMNALEGNSTWKTVDKPKDKGYRVQKNMYNETQDIWVSRQV